jgi:hypothetical protein
MAAPSPDGEARTSGTQPPSWLASIEMLGTTAIVLMVGAMVLWLKASVHGPRLVVTIGTGLLLYAAGVVGLGRRSAAAPVAPWPFAVAGLGAAACAELVNAGFLLTGEFGLAGLAGVVIGLAHWAALRTWLRLNGNLTA